MTQPSAWSPARVATVAALPVAFLVALVLLVLSTVVNGRTASGPAGPPGPDSTPAPSTPVALPARSLTPPAAAICRAVIAGLPEAVRSARRRPVTAGADQNAAYGEPPMTVACGAAPASFAATDRVDLLNGVCWYGVPGTLGSQWTTVDRTVPVAVWVPGPPDGSAQWAIAFSATIAAADPPMETAPTGCRAPLR